MCSTRMAAAERMEKQGENSVIHRKAQDGRSEFDARVMSPAKALRLSLAKAANRLFGLPLCVTTMEQTTLALGNVQQDIGDDGLLVLLDGATGDPGALKLDPQFLAALIEVQTLGQVRRGESGPRLLTRTDAAMAAPLIDGMLAGFDKEMTESSPGHKPLGYQFGVMMADARSLSLAMTTPDYDRFCVTLDIDGGAKSGVLTLLIPKLVPIADGAASKDADPNPWTRLEKTAMDAPVVMDAVMARLRLPLRDICSLRPGLRLPLSAEALGKTQLVGTGGHVVAEVQMGQMNGLRAVRLAPATDDRADPAELVDQTDSDGAAPDVAPMTDVDALNDGAPAEVAVESGPDTGHQGSPNATDDPETPKVDGGPLLAGAMSGLINVQEDAQTTL